MVSWKSQEDDIQIIIASRKLFTTLGQPRSKVCILEEAHANLVLRQSTDKWMWNVTVFVFAAEIKLSVFNDVLFTPRPHVTVALLECPRDWHASLPSG